MMIRAVWFLAVLSTLLCADGVVWEKNILAAVEKGKKTGKPVMILVSKDGCRWCDHLRENTLRDPQVIKELNSHFVNVEGFTNRGEVPSELITPGTPGTWFVKDGEPMLQPLMGALPVEAYMEALGVVLKTYKQ